METVGLNADEVAAAERETALAYQKNQTAAETSSSPSSSPSSPSSPAPIAAGPPMATPIEVQGALVCFVNPVLPEKGFFRKFNQDESERLGHAGAAFVNRYGLWLELEHKEAIGLAVVLVGLGFSRYREAKALAELEARAKLAKPEPRPAVAAA